MIIKEKEQDLISAKETMESLKPDDFAVVANTIAVLAQRQTYLDSKKKQAPEERPSVAS